MIRLAKPFLPNNTADELVRVLQSGFLTQGEGVSRFENELGDYLDTDAAVVVSSGTAALHLALLSLGIGHGDEVIVPAFSFPATANVVEHTGANSAFVDIRLNDFCLDPQAIRKAITPKTRAILVVHEFGQPADMAAITSIAGEYDLWLIEDAACALGASYAGKMAGTFGKLGCFSFHPRKCITTGEGGAIVTDDPELLSSLRLLRSHGLQIRGASRDICMPGLNYRMTEMQAVMGQLQLPHTDRLIDNRTAQMSLYNSCLSEHPGLVLPSILPERRHSVQTYHLLLPEGCGQNEMIQGMKHHGIEVNIGAYAFNHLSYYKNKYEMREEDFPNASAAYTRGLALPIGWHVTDAEIIHISETLLHLISDEN